jgi:hypothetical protein
MSTKSWLLAARSWDLAEQYLPEPFYNMGLFFANMIIAPFERQSGERLHLKNMSEESPRSRHGR